MKGIGFDGTVSWNSFGARVLVSFVGVWVGVGVAVERTTHRSKNRDETRR